MIARDRVSWAHRPIPRLDRAPNSSRAPASFSPGRTSGLSGLRRSTFARVASTRMAYDMDLLGRGNARPRTLTGRECPDLHSRTRRRAPRLPRRRPKSSRICQGQTSAGGPGPAPLLGPPDLRPHRRSRAAKPRTTAPSLESTGSRQRVRHRDQRLGCPPSLQSRCSARLIGTPKAWRTSTYGSCLRKLNLSSRRYGSRSAKRLPVPVGRTRRTDTCLPVGGDATTVPEARTWRDLRASRRTRLRLARNTRGSSERGVLSGASLGLELKLGRSSTHDSLGRPAARTVDRPPSWDRSPSEVLGATRRLTRQGRQSR